MASARGLFYLGICLCVGSITSTEDLDYVKDLRWSSLDFKTVLIWTNVVDSNLTVLTSEGDDNWKESSNCIQILDTECDLTNELKPLDRTYTADIQIEHPDIIEDVDDLPHVYSSEFNPYRESNISSLRFRIKALDDSRVAVNITDSLSGVHDNGKQLTIRDILGNDLKYKIGYHKAGSTGQKIYISDTSLAEVTRLDSGEVYCFVVMAYIPSRPKALQQGAMSTQDCVQVHGTVQGLSTGALVGIIFILLTVLIVAITVIVLCCKCCRQKSKSLQTTQSSAPI